MWFNLNDAATEFIKELNSSPDRYPDRVVGIVLGAMLDERIADTIKQCVPDDKKILEETFGHESKIFGTFGSLLALGYFLGLFTKETYRDLGLITKIRNSFAHKVEVHKFDDEPVRSRVDQLAIPNTKLEINNGGTIWIFDPALLPPLRSRRERYIRAIHALNLALFLEPANPGKDLKRTPRF